MQNTGFQIERLVGPVCDADTRSLAGVLVDAVESGAAVSFMQPLDLGRAEVWWRDVLAGIESGQGEVGDGRTRVFVARAQSEGNARPIVGTVQYQRAWAPNQPHRAEIMKLMVHRGSRGGGVGEALMRAAEADAAAAGLKLLTLDAKRGAPAERLYERLGWMMAGIIPRYALDPDGSGLHDTVVYYKELP